MRAAVGLTLLAAASGGASTLDEEMSRATAAYFHADFDGATRG